MGEPIFDAGYQTVLVQLYQVTNPGKITAESAFEAAV